LKTTQQREKKGLDSGALLVQSLPGTGVEVPEFLTTSNRSIRKTSPVAANDIAEK
jgi:hypothetical protein